MSRLIELNELNIDNFITLLKDEIIVYENIQGSKIFVNWNGYKFTIKPKAITQEAINPIDLAVQKYYAPAFDYFDNLDIRIKKLLNKKYWYVFEYFCEDTVYQKTPKNNLVLTGILKNNKYTSNPQEINEFSDLLDVDPQPIIFWGKLNTEQIELITYFLKTSPNDLEYVFGEKNFAFFFYRMLNPQLKNSFLMDDGFLKNMDKIIIKSLREEISLAVFNPLYNKTAPYDSEHLEVYSLILLNFLEFMQSIDITTFKLTGADRYEMYIDLISQIFNLYLERRVEALNKFDFSIPAYFKDDKFKINPEMISNPKTVELIKMSEKIEYIFKIVLGSMKKKKNKIFGVFNQTTLNFFNHYVDQIDYYLDKQLRFSSDIIMNNTDILNFNQFMDLPMNRDASGKVYPDLLDTYEQPGADKKKKGFTK